MTGPRPRAGKAKREPAAWPGARDDPEGTKFVYVYGIAAECGVRMVTDCICQLPWSSFTIASPMARPTSM